LENPGYAFAIGGNGNFSLQQGNQSFSLFPYNSFFIVDPGIFDCHVISDFRGLTGSIWVDRNFFNRLRHVSSQPPLRAKRNFSSAAKHRKRKGSLIMIGGAFIYSITSNL